MRSDTRREMIAQAARALLAEKGLAGLRTRDLAQRVGISLSTLHFHVRTKDALLAFVAETSRDAFFACLPPEPAEAKDARAQLRAEAQALYDTLRHQPELPVSFQQLEQAAAAQPQVAATMAGFKTDWAERYRRIIAIGRDQGVFRADVAPYPAALMVTGALVAFIPHGPDGLAQFWPVFDEIERGLLAQGISEVSDVD